MDEKKTGFISYSQLKGLLYKCNLFSPKEANLIIRQMSGDPFEYKNLEQVLYDARFELAKSRLMDTNIGGLAEHLTQMFAEFDFGEGRISIN